MWPVVDVDLTSDQELFRRTTTRFIEATCPLGAVRESTTTGADAGGEYRRQAAELGWFAMLVPEELGGGRVSENGLLDAALVAQARGAALQPGPFVGTNVVAYALAEEGNQDHQSKVLPLLLSGDESATWAVASSAADGSPEAGVLARQDAVGYVLSGTKDFVQDAHRSAWMLVTAAGDNGSVQFLVPADTTGVVIKPLDGLDLTRRFCEVRFEDAELPPSAIVGDYGGATGLVERQLQIACVLTVAESIGAMDRDFDVATQYAKDRTAFGRPVGSFQAMKHLLADTSLMLEMSKAMAAAAARAVGTGQPDAAEVASMAKAFVGDCGVDLAQNCFQVFGGIGYTWEHDQHLYLRRITTDAALYGDPAWHRERLCQLSGL
jgi:alkylation response protein AidB-like acyl-CoA dehydrogenase